MAEIEADLARVTAERDHWIDLYKERNKTAAILESSSIDLRARVAELEDKAERYRLTTLRQDATIAELTTDGNAATLAVGHDLPDDSSRGVSNLFA